MPDKAWKKMTDKARTRNENRREVEEVYTQLSPKLLAARSDTFDIHIRVWQAALLNYVDDGSAFCGEAGTSPASCSFSE